MWRADNKNLPKLIDILAATSKDPLKFVQIAFPWGKGELENYLEPLKWQKDILQYIKESSISPDEAIKIAVSSGHGVGKSALVAWLTLWSISTKPNTKGVITANTETQLKTKTWAELAKWHRISLITDIFTLTATALFSSDARYEKTWRIDMVPWSEHNTEAFAGLHNQGGRIILIFDEASAIPDNIWEVAEGALTDKNTEILWLAFGNPTRPKGRFRECFGRFRHRWHTLRVDSRSVELTNKSQIEKWIADYGLDSDFIRMRVLGEFPLSLQNQLISQQTVNEALGRQQADTSNDPIVLGIDVARFGSDSSVIIMRQGSDAKILKRLKNTDTMTLAGIASEIINTLRPDGIFIDQTGVGGGVVDRLRQMGHNVCGVDFGSQPSDKSRFFNKRAEIWCLMAEWLKVSGKIPYDNELISDLTAPEYSFSGDKGQIILERKESIKRRGLASPDTADALALTFSFPVSKRSLFESLPWGNKDMNDLTRTNI